MLKTISAFVLSLALIFTLQGEVFAKKKIVLKSSSGGATTVSKKPVIGVKFRSDRKALVLSASSANTASVISYELTYDSNGVAQGVVGAIRPTASTAKAELYFGTCSAGVCRPHTNLSNMKLSVISTLNSGQKIKRSFKVKI